MKKIKIAFVNPPSIDTELFSPVTWIWMKSYYDNFGKYKDLVEWLEPPFKYNRYQSCKEIWEEVNTADIILYSSYIWNTDIIDEVARLAKNINPNIVNVLGGPQIGQKDIDIFKKKTMYDYFCQVTKPGELFMQDFIDSYFENNGIPNIEDISFELRSTKCREWQFPNVCAYEENFDYLKKIKDYADIEGIFPHVLIETTRGCPFHCTYCEWGGGIGTKVLKKPEDIVIREIDVLHKLGYKQIYNVDANFGLFLERDLFFLKYAYDLGMSFINSSLFKTTNLDKKIKIIDEIFKITGTDTSNGRKSIVPNIGIQSLSDNAMKISKRVDLNKIDKIQLIEYCEKNFGASSPFMEFIRAMPGSTLDDFYDELLVIYNSLENNNIQYCFYDYMALPDSEITDDLYCALNKIKLVEVFTQTVEEGISFISSGLYKNRKNYFKTISSCNSYTLEDNIQMFIMSFASDTLVRKLWKNLKDVLPDVRTFLEYCWTAMNNISSFKEIYNDVKDTLNYETAAKDITKINGKNRLEIIEEFINSNEQLIYNNLFEEIVEYGSNNQAN
jgi:hypothetical protein